MNPYDWQQDAVFDHPADLLLRGEQSDELIFESHGYLVGMLLEEELRAENLLEGLRSMESALDWEG